MHTVIVECLNISLDLLYEYLDIDIRMRSSRRLDSGRWPHDFLVSIIPYHSLEWHSFILYIMRSRLIKTKVSQYTLSKCPKDHLAFPAPTLTL